MNGREAGRYVRVAALHPGCRTLGPGRRCVVWVQGCPLDCAGCVTPEWIPAAGGTEVAVSELADLIADEAWDGLTLSGGEPFAQASALAQLVSLVRAQRDLSVMSYSGWTLEHLRAHGTAEQHRLLDGLDILVDGPYVRRRHADLRWRGSDNQRVHLLTPRHLDWADRPDHGAGLQFVFGPGPTVRWMGVPAVPGFREAFVHGLGLVPDRTAGPASPLHPHTEALG
ncbi:radical SAM protein [Streptomyces sp. NBC_01381]|uniref:4Fe-4S single cluster domain-containing protein n=1 Tax=Streptomyces sp. NBC_01381 TaxID=2903845 RepID=UPI002256962A|nr:4Fe-4S single cluster domain-containing protein [Streptomyces sp. NBC_01381]MCX4673530.1 radical SAM protein [Streptomyces sp. NBC_01381]